MARRRRRAGGLRCRLAVAGAVVAVLAAGPAGSFDSSGVERALADSRTQEALSAFILTRPLRCVQASETEKHCVWHIGNMYSSWEPIALAIGTDARVNVICRVPVDGGEREPGSCLGYPSRSNRSSYKVVEQKRRGRPRPDRKSKAVMRDRARSALAGARDFDALVALLGDLPADCFGEIGGERSCLWRLDKRTLGHGTVAASADLSFRKRLRFSCSFDPAWQLRSSCTAEVDN